MMLLKVTEPNGGQSDRLRLLAATQLKNEAMRYWKRASVHKTQFGTYNARLNKTLEKRDDERILMLEAIAKRLANPGESSPKVTEQLTHAATFIDGGKLEKDEPDEQKKTADIGRSSTIRGSIVRGSTIRG